MRWGLLLLTLAHFARAAEPSVSPSEIKPSREAGVAISCAHFRARVRAEMEGFRETFWYLKGPVDEAQFADYFKNRLAADPMDVAASRVADVHWSIPKTLLPQTAQVFEFYELARQDYSGAQMRFEVPNRTIQERATTLEVDSPVRMMDVCMNKFIELKVLSDCPIETVSFLGNTQIVSPLECQKIQTVNLSLDGVEEAIVVKKAVLDRATGGGGLNVSSSAGPCTGEDVKAARLLENLRDVRKLHNCELDVVKLLKKDTVEYSIYARDLFACQFSRFACLESEVSLSIPASCSDGLGLAPASVHFESGINHENSNFTAELNAQLNRSGQVTSLSLLHLDAGSGTRFDDVFCRSQIYGGIHAY